MKKTIAFFMALLLAFNVGCAYNKPAEILSSIPEVSQNQSTVSHEEPKVENNGIFQLNLDENIADDMFSVCLKDDYLLFGYTKSYGEGDDYIEKTGIILYDLVENEIIAKLAEEELQIESFWGCKFDNDNIVAFDGNKGKQAIYDMNLQLISTDDYVYVDESESEGKNSPFYTSQVSVFEKYSIFYSASQRYFYFNNDLETLYVVPNSISFCDCYENNSLVSYQEDESITYYVNDYKNGKTINYQKFYPKEGFDEVYGGDAMISENYAIIPIWSNDFEGEEYAKTFYCWDYKGDAKNEDKNDVETYTYSSLSQYNTKKISELETEYDGIDISVNSPCGDIWDMVNCSGTTNPILVHSTLTGIEKFLKMLPDGMLREIYSEYDFWEDDFKGIRIDIVNDITYQNDVSAFAQSWGEYMKICFDMYEFYDDTVAHEFMHLMDYRIEDYYKDESFDSEWTDKYNADYINDASNDMWDDTSTEEFVFEPTNFINYYATTNSTEDRATIFEYLYSVCDNDELPEHFKDEYKGIKNKFIGICDAIEKAFPSVQKADEVFWERFVA